MGGARKPGDKYNYDVAAYLKLNEYQYGTLKLNLTRFDFNAAPDFPPDASVFARATSMDLFASTSSDEFIFECKSSDRPTPIHVTSTEFKKALFEFISLEKYRRAQPRTVTFGLITNKSIDELVVEINDLKSNPSILNGYVEQIHAQRVPDWQDINQTITAEQVLLAINNMIPPIFIEKGLLSHFEKDKNFREAREEIVKEVEKKDPFIVPPSIATMTRIELLLENDDEYTCRKREGILIRISTKILREIEQYERRLSQKLTLATSRELPFLSCCTFVRCPQVTTEQAGDLLTEVINDCIEEDLGTALFIAAFLPGQSEIFFAEAKWLSTLADSPDPTSNCLLLYRNGNVIPVPPYVYPLLLRETRRILDRTIITPKFSTSDDLLY